MNLLLNTNSTWNSSLAKANYIIIILFPPAKAGGNSKDGGNSKLEMFKL